MNKFLKDFDLIDIKGLAVLRYKALGLSEEELVVLLLIHSLKQADFKIITHELIGQYVTFDKQKIDSVLVSLVNKGMILVVGTNVSLDLFYKKLVYETPSVVEIKEEGINLIEAFENEFARGLTPMELETIREWKMSGYADQMILDALKEATLHNAHSFRYIEKILIDWTKNGVKRSGKEKIAPVDDEEFVEYNWWDEDD